MGAMHGVSVGLSGGRTLSPRLRGRNRGTAALPYAAGAASLQRRDNSRSQIAGGH
jgi:hypothetical protein